jgi:hypothetical protein
MENDDVALAVRQLIHRHIRSMDHAEAALYLASAPGGARDVETVAAQHRWASRLAARVLNDLVETGLVVSKDGEYRLASDSADAAELSGLSELYHRQPVTLARTIYSAPVPLKTRTRPPRLEDDRSSST